jgi:tetratricopeptide (TPR) repeat protein
MESQKVIYLYWLGIVEKKHGLLEQAKQRFTKALQYEKDSAKIQYQLGIVLFEMQDYKTAIPVFEKLQDHNQFKANVIWYLAHSYQQIHDEIKTDRYFLKLKELQNTTNFQKK